MNPWRKAKFRSPLTSTEAFPHGWRPGYSSILYFGEVRKYRTHHLCRWRRGKDTVDPSPLPSPPHFDQSTTLERYEDCLFFLMTMAATMMSTTALTPSPTPRPTSSTPSSLLPPSPVGPRSTAHLITTCWMVASMMAFQRCGGAYNMRNGGSLTVCVCSEGFLWSISISRAC